MKQLLFFVTSTSFRLELAALSWGIKKALYQVSRSLTNELTNKLIVEQTILRKTTTCGHSRFLEFRASDRLGLSLAVLAFVCHKVRCSNRIKRNKEDLSKIFVQRQIPFSLHRLIHSKLPLAVLINGRRTKSWLRDKNGNLFFSSICLNHLFNRICLCQSAHLVDSV